jgi:glycosyltransferase involved in cell wall biosynthesis
MLPITSQINSKAANYKFSIIIPSWNNLVYLKFCIASIRKNSHFEHQIIVHVNEGADGTCNWLSSEHIDFTYSSQNVGVCYAVNAMRTLVSTDYIVYLNDDMYVCPNWDLHFWTEIQKIGHHNFFLSATMIERTGKGHNPVVIYANYGDCVENFEESRLLAEYDLLPKDDWNGSTWPPNIVHKQTWDLIGGYSIEYTPGMYSDPDFSMKLWHSGVRIFKGVSKARVYHFISKTVGRVKRNNGRKQFLKKWSITAGNFFKFYLQMGTKFNGLLVDPDPAQLRFKRLIDNIKSRF